jgi:hypothetical protein
MVPRLQEAFEEVSKLPPEEQERWAEWLLEELRAEQKWDELLASPESHAVPGEDGGESRGGHSGGTCHGADKSGL